MNTLADNAQAFEDVAAFLQPVACIEAGSAFQACGHHVCGHCLKTCRSGVRFSANNGRRQGPGRPMRNKTFCIVKCPWKIDRFAANDGLQRGSGRRKSEDSFDEALAFFVRAAPPSPLQAGAPAWAAPGPLRGPLHHQGRRSCRSKALVEAGF